MKCACRSNFVTIPGSICFFLSMAVLTVLTIIDLKLAFVGLLGLSFIVFLMVSPLFWLAALLILLIPYHSLITQLLGGYGSSSRQLFALWKEILIFIGLLRALIENPGRMIILRSNRWVLLLAGGLVAAYLVAFFRLPSIPAMFSLNGETRFVAVVMFFMLLPLEQRRINLLLQLMVMSVGVVAAYGVIQYFWDYERLLHLVYHAPDVFTDTSKRLYSFSLNSLEPAYGAVIAIIILLSVRSRRAIGRWFWVLPLLTLLIPCLILTYTRSAYLGLIAGGATALTLDRPRIGRHIVFVFIGIWVISAGLLLGGASFFGSNFGKRLDSIVSQKDASSMVHKERMKSAINIVSRNPLGIGLGKFGIVQARFEGGIEKSESAENWVLQVGVQTGLIGVSAYVLLTFAVFLSLLRKSGCNLINDNHLRIAACGVFVAMTVAGVLIPVWDSLLPLIYTWALVGLALRPHDGDYGITTLRAQQPHCLPV